MKKLIYPIILISLTIIYCIFKDKLNFTDIVDILFLFNLPVMIVSVFLFTVEKKLWNTTIYSFKRFAILFPYQKRKRLMDEFQTLDSAEMERKVREKYLYREYDFDLLDYTLIPSCIFFIIPFVIFWSKV